MPIIYKSFYDTRQIDDDQQAFKILDKVSHLKKFSAEEGDDDNTFVQWADDITDTLSGLCCTGTFLKLLISSALSGRAKNWFDSATEGIDGHVIKTYNFEKFLALLSGEFDGAKFLRRERFTELLKLSIDSEKSLETFAYISGRLTPYYLSSGAALDLFLSKLEPHLQKQLENSAFPLTLDVALLMTACEFAKGASSRRKHRNKNTRDFDINTSKIKNAAKVSKISDTETVNENSVIEKSDRKNYSNENELQISDTNLRKRNGRGVQLSLLVAERKRTLSYKNFPANAYASKNGQSNLIDTFDLHTHLRNGESRQYALNAISTQNNDRSIQGTTNIDLINDEVANMKKRITINNDRTDEITSSLNLSRCAVKRNSLQLVSPKTFKGSAELQDPKMKRVLGNGMSIGTSQTTHVFSHPGTPTVGNPARKNGTSRSSQIKGIAHSNPFTANENEKILNLSESFKNPVTSMEINRLSSTAGLKKISGSVHEENKRPNLSTQKSYPLHNFAVRTRNAHFNDRPSNYTSAHEITDATCPLSPSIDSIQCLTGPKSMDAETNKATMSSYMVAQDEKAARSINVETKSRKFPNVINPFLTNAVNKKKKDYYYI